MPNNKNNETIRKAAHKKIAYLTPIEVRTREIHKLATAYEKRRFFCAKSMQNRLTGDDSVATIKIESF